MLMPRLTAALLALLLALPPLHMARAQNQAAGQPPHPSDALPDFARAPAGTDMPALSFFDSAQDQTSLARLMMTRYHGQPALVVFWAPWCQSCVQDLAALDHLAALGQGKLAVITIAVQDDAHGTIPGYFKRHNVQNLPPYWQPGMGSLVKLGITALPAAILVDTKGHEVDRIIPTPALGSEAGLAHLLGLAKEP